MLRLIFQVLFAFLITYSLLAANAQDTEGFDDFEEDSETYIFIDGPIVGVRINSVLLSPIVPPDLNPNTDADGHIAFEDKGCKHLHYHGFIFDEDDPNPSMCGWGKVSLETELSENFVELSSAINDEIIAQRLFSLSMGEIDKIVDVVSSVIEARNDLSRINGEINKALKEKRINKKAAKKIKRNILCAIALDNEVFDMLVELAEKKNEIGEEFLVTGKLDKALKCKRKALEIMRKIGFI